MWQKSLKIYLYFEEIMALYLNAMLLVDLVRMIVPGSLQILASFVQAFIYGIGFVYMVLLICWKQTVNRYLLFFVMVSSIISLGSLILEPEIAQFYPYFLFSFLLRYIPGMYYILEIENIAGLFRSMKKYILVWLLYAVVGIRIVPLTTPNGYSMTFGYNLFFALSFLFVYFYKEKKIRYLLLEGIVFMAVVLRASRGILVCFGMFVILFLMTEIIKKLTAERSFALLLSGIIAIVSVFNLNYMLKLAAIILPNSRSLMLLSSNLTFDSGRGSIQQVFNEEIAKNVFAVRGIFSDRMFFTHNQSGAPYSITNYPHNLICEVVFQFGIVLGVIFLLFLMCGTIKSMKIVKEKSMEVTAVFYMLMSIGVIQLFFSNSYLISYTFFMYIGIMLKLFTKGRDYCDKSVAYD